MQWPKEKKTKRHTTMYKSCYKPGAKSWMVKGSDCDYQKWNMYMIGDLTLNQSLTTILLYNIVCNIIEVVWTYRPIWSPVIILNVCKIKVLVA
jgi:hypothetical protein